MLCFSIEFHGRRVERCYLRWLDTCKALAANRRDGRGQHRPRVLTAAEQTGPFTTFRWAVQGFVRSQGHPQGNGPMYGVINPREILYRVHMVRSIHDPELFRLNTDVCGESFSRDMALDNGLDSICY